MSPAVAEIEPKPAGGSGVPWAPGTSPSLSPPPLWRGSCWNLGGTVVYAACQWGILVALAKLGSPEAVGRFAFGLALTAPIFLFANLQLRSIQATDARGEFTFADYLALRLAMIGLAGLVVAGLVGLGRLDPATGRIVVAVAVAKAIESIGDIFHGHFQRHERMDRVAVSMMLKGVLSLAALGGIMAATGRVAWAASGLALAWAAVLIGFDVPAALRLHARANQPRVRAAGLARLARLALPLGIVMATISVGANLPRYFIERQSGPRDLGFFAAMAYLMVASNTVINALGQAASPRMARDFAEGRVGEFRARLARLLGLAAGVGVLAVAAVAACGRPILAALYAPEYAARADVFLGLTVAAAVSSLASLAGFGMTAARCLWVQTPLFLGVAGVMAISCAGLIPALGLRGAAMATVAAALAQLVGSVVVLEWALRRQGIARSCPPSSSL